MSEPSTDDQKASSSRWSFLNLLETIFPLCLAILAALLSINDLLSNNVGSLEIKLGNLRNSSYQWYQSKGIKATITEGQRDLLMTLLTAESTSKSKNRKMLKSISEVEKKLTRYNMEKKEILLGSSEVGEKGWAQEVGGHLGKVVGAKEYDAYLEILEAADNSFGFASMVLQVSLVIGAIGIMLKKPNIKVSFFCFMMLLSGIGVYMAFTGLMIAKTVPLY